MADALSALAEDAGILPVYRDVTGVSRVTGVDTQLALLRAAGVPIDRADQAAGILAARRAEAARRRLPRFAVVPCDEMPDLSVPRTSDWQITLEDGAGIAGRGPLPALPLGIHRLTVGADTCWLLSAPRRLPLPARTWGVTVPLWGLTGPRRGGLGSYADLADTAAGFAAAGAGFLGINPVHAGFPHDATAYSPYQPSHRRRLNILHLAGGAPASSGPLVDYAREIPAKLAALRAAYDRFDGDPKFDAYLETEGAALHRFALHQALSDRHGAYWTDWPADLHAPDSGATRAAAAELAGELRFHAWAQWQAETALAHAQAAARDAGMAHGLYLDLAVGTHPAGAETWEDPRSFVRGVSLGAPPDAFAPDGQTWNLAPLHPAHLIRTGFRVLAETLRRQIRACGILRIDHILGFERAFWVPESGGPGAYMAMPRDAMLAVVRIEAARGGAVIVGEDLGVVPDGLRAKLKSAGILGCRLAMFERRRGPAPRFRKARSYPAAAITSFSTHDLPTWDGWRAGRDLEDWHAVGNLDAASIRHEAEKRKAEVAGLDAVLNQPSAEGLHGFLAATPSRLVAVQAETLTGEMAQPNLPGTVHDYPNWQRRLPVAGPGLARGQAVADTAAIMEKHGRGRT